jgi:hypothetical protein
MTAERRGTSIARELGAAACLVKPFSVDTLLDELSHLLPAPSRPAGLSVPLSSPQTPRSLA